MTTTARNQQIPSTSASYEVEVVEDTTPDWDREFFEGHPLPLAAGTGPRFPTSNPRGFPHIIAKRFCEDFDKVALTTLTLADGVATMLYRLEKERTMPGLLDKFFERANTRMSNGRGTGDFQVNEFTVTAKVPSGFIMPLFIARTKAHVLVGLRDGDGWEEQLLFDIDTEGKWIPVGSYGTYTVIGKERDPAYVQERGAKLAQHILLHRRWAGANEIEVSEH